MSSAHRTAPPAAADAVVLAKVATRARAFRQALGWTRRAVAERAGLSERFLAQIEGGAGNPSVLSMAALARALHVTVGDFFDRTDDEMPESQPPLGPTRAVALLGLRGAGKSTIGARAAAEARARFVELDVLVEHDAGLAAGELFELQGAAYYRKLEREALDRTLGEGGSVMIATTGGLVTDHGALERVLATTTSIWLRATPEDHFRRVIEQGDTRPMQNRDRAMDELRAILRARRALYERAHHVVDTSRLGLERSVDRVVKIARRALAS
jgi:XRE family aerobic/anaerobic benzoate catabolism transcriptional regulator